MSILKSADENGSACCRFTYVFSAVPGLGHFIHTYAGDGNPLPTFSADPERVTVPDSADELFSRCGKTSMKKIKYHSLSGIPISKRERPRSAS